MKIKFLSFRKENLLPIVDESGAVFGKITYNQSIKEKNEYVHPIVRIALIHKGKLFLSAKENIEADNKLCLDYPFERHILYKETIDKTVAKTLEPTGFKFYLTHNCKYLFHYMYRSEKIHRLVYFYFCNLRDDSLLKKLNLSNGKWWIRKQIKENLNTGLFSSLFENEFEFLDSTLLAID
jgi:hypothetical protein